MNIERQLAAFIRNVQAEEAPGHVVGTAKQVILTVLGTALAGTGEDGIASLRSVLVQRGGQPEATTWVFGDKVPASSAALLNGAMARALDYCDAMKPGLHLGSSVVPAALAASELFQDCSGQDFLAAVIAGLETGSRLNLTEEQYGGFDPTGVAGVMGATAAAARVARLSEDETLHALALAFNRCGGSFQSNIDGSLAVRLIQGWVAQIAIECVQLARAGLTGPRNFLGGTYGYMRLFGRGSEDPATLLEGIGIEYELTGMVFKKFPSCGVTQSVTELALDAVRSPGFDVDDIQEVEVHLPPYAFRLVGHPFEMGDTPKVNAQFSAQYCVANALLRGDSRLEHFRPESVADSSVGALMQRIRVKQAHELDEVGHTAARLTIDRSGHPAYSRSIETAPGFPGNPLSQEEHLQRFRDCLSYAGQSIPAERESSLVASVDSLEDIDDIRSLIKQLSPDL
ncbi:MmgE/PrpD family protein [Arthrobacter sp. LjRoot78]|uniref:MmgE/PrpD family protein n=1 Tax=Arthrobacter sp. LjRoot78 TaxID=3342338 RepID=UPI003ECDC669